MQIIYYYDAERKLAPVKQFLSKYAISSNDKPNLQEHKLKMLALIDEVIKKAADNKGIVGGNFSELLTGHFQAFRIKDGSILNRIFYFCYHLEKLVLLNALDKPEKYEKGLKKKVDKKYEEVLIQTEEYYRKFINNPKSYEEYR